MTRTLKPNRSVLRPGSWGTQRPIFRLDQLGNNGPAVLLQWALADHLRTAIFIDGLTRATVAVEHGITPAALHNLIGGHKLTSFATFATTLEQLRPRFGPTDQHLADTVAAARARFDTWFADHDPADEPDPALTKFDHTTRVRHELGRWLHEQRHLHGLGTAPVNVDHIDVIPIIDQRPACEITILGNRAIGTIWITPDWPDTYTKFGHLDPDMFRLAVDYRDDNTIGETVAARFDHHPGPTPHTSDTLIESHTATINPNGGVRWQPDEE